MRAKASGISRQGSGLRTQGSSLGFRVQDAGFRVQGSRVRSCRLRDSPQVSLPEKESQRFDVGNLNPVNLGVRNSIV